MVPIPSKHEGYIKEMFNSKEKELHTWVTLVSR
jgi:hypothetical protein